MMMGVIQIRVCFVLGARPAGTSCSPIAPSYVAGRPLGSGDELVASLDAFLRFAG